MLQILLVEDNKSITDSLTYTLEKEGYAVDVCADAQAAEHAVFGKVYDLAILDIALPGGAGSGYDVCKLLKDAQPDVPVIFLTARDEENDVVKGFDLGADDYVAKPFRNRELLSRIASVLRRYNKNTREITVGDLRLDLVKTRLFRRAASVPGNKTDEAETKDAGEVVSGAEGASETEVELTALEMRIVEYLFQNRGVTLSREKILDRIWDYAGDVVNDNTLTVYIKRVRDKLGEDVVKTVRGVGYRVD